MILALFLTLFLLLLIPTYYQTYGVRNFLWFSDIGLFLTTAALWLQSSLLISIVTIAILPVEILWNIDFALHILESSKTTSLSRYMFDNRHSLFVRSLSLFHCILPPIIIYYLIRWGYNPQALPYSLLLIGSVYLTTYTLTTSKENINLVFLPHKAGWNWMPSVAWPVLLFLGHTISIIAMHIAAKIVV